MTTTSQAGGANPPLALFSGSVPGTLLRLGGLVFIDACALWLTYQLFGNGQWLMAVAVIVATVLINAAFLSEGLYPYRWLAPGLALIILMVLYPIIVTVYYAFTNYATGNLQTRPVAIEQIQTKPEYRYIPPDEQFYDATIYRAEDGTFLLWLVGRDDASVLLATSDGALREATPAATGLGGVTFNDDAPPDIEGFQQLDPADASEFETLASLTFDAPLGTVEFTDITDATEAESGFLFDPAERILVDYTGRSPDVYNATVYRNDAGEYALWLEEDGGRGTILARPGQPVIIDGQPQRIDEFVILGNRERTAVSTLLPELEFGEPDNPILIDAFSASRAGRFVNRFDYDADRDVMVDVVSGAVYRPIEGTFTLDPTTVNVEEAEVDLPGELLPGYYVVTGFDTFRRLFTDQRLWSPFVTIFIWTVIHALATVVITFALGLGLALLLNDRRIPARKVLRSLILIPYAIPAFISTVVWRGMFDPNLGIVNEALSVVGLSPAWYGDPTAARTAILLIQLWLGFPYMMLITTGALQSIPDDIYEAAKIDGASPWQQFRFMTLPLLLVVVGPLLIASFAFNFNNFTVIELYNNGGPAIAMSAVPAGHTDILITYTYAQAFGTAGGTDYAFASAISIFIFFIVATITIFNFRFTRAWEEVSENV